MANKKDLKRTINYICSDLFAECIATSLYGSPKPSEEDINALLSSILIINSDYIKRISHPEPGMQPKKYFKVLINDFNKQVGEIVDQISSLG